MDLVGRHMTVETTHKTFAVWVMGQFLLNDFCKVNSIGKWGKILIIVMEFLPYVPPILGQLLDLISPPKINISEPKFGLYDPWDLAN